MLEGKRVILVDDSIVRGTSTSPSWIAAPAGAAEVHMRISSPPIMHPCFMGVDMATYDELIAHHHSVPEIEKLLGANSLGYLSLAGLIRAVDRPADQFCLSCFVGQYPFKERLGGFVREPAAARGGH